MRRAYVLDTKGEITGAKDAFLRIVGYTREDQEGDSRPESAEYVRSQPAAAPVPASQVALWPLFAVAFPVAGQVTRELEVVVPSRPICDTRT